MSGIILTRPRKGGGGTSNTFETLILDSGTLTAVGADTLIIAGGNAIVTTGSSSPNTLTIDVDPTDINLGDLGDVSVGGAVTGAILGFNGTDWIPIDLSTAIPDVTAGTGINVTTIGSPFGYQVSLNIGTLPIGSSSPTTLAFTDTIAVYTNGVNEQYTLQQVADVLNFASLDIFAAMREPTGYVNRSDSVMSFNSNTRQFTIQPQSVSFDYYIHGIKHTITTPKTVTLPAATGLYHVYFDDTETLNVTTNFTVDILKDYAYTANIYWNNAPVTGTVNPVLMGEERHGLTMDAETHLHFHESWGCQYISGLALSNIIVDVASPTNGNVQFGVTNGVIRDEDLRHIIRDESSVATELYDLVQDLSPVAQIPVLFRTGGGVWNQKPADNYPLIYSDGVVFTGVSNGLPAYNSFSAGVWSLTEVQNNSYFLMHYLATNDVNHPIVAIQGITNYTTKPAGQEQAQIELNQLSGLPYAEFTPIATVIVEARTSYTNIPQIRYVSTDAGDAYIDWRSSDNFSSAGGGLNDHGSLVGLTDDDHPQYTLNAYDSISDGTNTETASGRGNTIKFEGSGGITTTVGQTGSPSTDTVTIGIAGDPDLALSIINGQPILTFVDSTRTKRLSVAEQTLVYSESQLTVDDWLDVGGAVDADSGFIADFDGTVVYATAHCEDTGIESKEIHLFINGSDAGTIGSLTGGPNATFINTTINVDFARGDKIRLQAKAGTIGAIQDVVAKLTIKWRVS